MIRRIWEIIKEPLNDIATVANVLDWIHTILQWIIENLF